MPAGDDDTVAGSPYTAETAAALPALVAGRYQIVRWLGGGGMGRVYEVTDTELGENVALKMLRGDLDDESLARFRREVRLTRKIQHENIARMFDIGETANGEKFLTMELVLGDSLASALGKPMPWPELQQIAIQICRGLAAAHDKGVVHRDLKPDNVLVERATKRAVLTDFGIARGADDTQGNVTQTGMVVGTPRYMAPEQLAGRTTDARSDLFSLGVMLYELASGLRPWAGDNPIAIAVAIATQPMQPLRVPGLPPGFVAIVESLLAVDPAQRPVSATDVGARLAALTSASAVAATGPTQMAPAVTTGSGRGIAPPDEESTIAVLPLTASAEDEYLADGMREDLIDMLSTSKGLRVRPAGSIDARRLDPREAGRELGVDHVVSGSVRRTPSGLRIAARLVGVADGFQIWAHRIDCTEAEVLAIGDQLGRAIVEALSSRASNRHSVPTDPRAVELYLRARAELRRFWGDHALAASKLLEEATQIAPDSPQIAGLLACASVFAWAKLNKPELLDKARRAVERGLALDHPEAYLAASQLHWNLGELEASAHDLRIGLERAPMNALAHEMLGRLLIEVDPSLIGRQHLETAMSLDPTRRTIIISDIARLDAMDARWEDANRLVGELLSHADIAVIQFGTMLAMRLAIWRGDLDALGTMLDDPNSRLPAFGNEIATVVRRWRSERVFDRVLWDATLAQLMSPERPKRMQLTVFQRAIELAALCEQHEAALSAFQSATERGLTDLVWANRCPLFARYQAEPRWKAGRELIEARAARVFAVLRGAPPNSTLLGATPASRRE